MPEGESYYRVAWTTPSEEVLERELGPLGAICDHAPKYLLTMDVGRLALHDGIRQLNVLDWLLGRAQ